MKEYISIRNVGPIKEVYNIEINPLTILIGPSASGKSTLMKIIILMRYIYKRLNIRYVLKYSNISKSPFRIVFNRLIKTAGLNTYFNEDSFVSYIVKINNNIYEIRYAKGKLEKFPEIKKQDLIFLKESFISENRNIIPSWIEKSASNSHAALGFYFHETLDEFTRAISTTSQFELSQLDMKLAIEKSKSKPLKLVVKDEGDSIDLKNASSGVQSSTPISVLLEYYSQTFDFKSAFKRSVLEYLYDIDSLSSYKPSLDIDKLKRHIHLHIEEPELSLFPNAQMKLMEMIVKKAFITNTQDRDLGVIIATHSPYILNYLNVILTRFNCDENVIGARLSPEQLSVYYIERGFTRNLVSTNERGEYIVNTGDFSDQMEIIFNEYVNLIQKIK